MSRVQLASLLQLITLGKLETETLVEQRFDSDVEGAFYSKKQILPCRYFYTSGHKELKNNSLTLQNKGSLTEVKPQNN